MADQILSLSSLVDSNTRAATRDDERPVSGEFHGEDSFSVSDEIAALEESRLTTTGSGSETVFFKR